MTQLVASGGQKYWSFSFSISPSNEYSGLISFRMDWFDLLAVFERDFQRDFQESSPARRFENYQFFWSSAFFVVQLSRPYMTTGKTTAWTRCTFVGRVMPLLLNMLFSFVIAFLPRSRHLNFTTAVTIHGEFGAQENRICRCFHFYPICP